MSESRQVSNIQKLRKSRIAAIGRVWKKAYPLWKARKQPHGQFSVLRRSASVPIQRGYPAQMTRPATHTACFLTPEYSSSRHPKVYSRVFLRFSVFRLLHYYIFRKSARRFDHGIEKMSQWILHIKSRWFLPSRHWHSLGTLLRSHEQWRTEFQKKLLKNNMIKINEKIKPKNERIYVKTGCISGNNPAYMHVWLKTAKVSCELFISV